MNTIAFDVAYKQLTGNDAFPWQRDLYENWFSQGKFPDACSIPTGLGKTSVLAVWLIALANEPDKLPRRLVYVVNRRTVVDQTTTEAEKIQRNAAAAGVPIPEISTLRGQFADNRKWSADPSRPAVIVGTVDMIGSRLLFSGYGCGFKTRPLHAGFLGQDALLIHDEAHLEPAFQELIVNIQREQHEKERTEALPWPKLRVMELTATSRSGGTVLALSDNDRADAEVQKRIEAKKTIHLHQNKDVKKLADEIAELALQHEKSGRAVLVFVRKVEDVEKVLKRLPKNRTRQLTGTLRGLERDQLVEDAIFRRFLPNAEQGEQTVYFVCTSAGEVGVNISADHLVCDLTTFDSMAQRFGRVNRFGNREDTRIDIVCPRKFEDNDLDKRRKMTLDLLQRLNGNASPAALNALDAAARVAAFAPPPTIPPTSDILFDAWALTTIRGKLPGRPMVEPYLHGISEDDPPQTAVAWREEVELLTPEVLEKNKLEPEDALEMYPLKPHEELSGPTYGKNKVFEQLEKIAVRDAKREADKRLSVWVIEPDGSVMVHSLEKLVEKDKQNKPAVPLGGRTVVLPPHAGGFNGELLQGDEPFDARILYDVSGEWYTDAAKTHPRRARVYDDDEQFDEKTDKMRLVRRIDMPASGGDEDAGGRSWYWFTRPDSADDDGSKTAREPITWRHHTVDVEKGATALANALLKNHPDLHKALVFAARFHDLGKKRIVWQRSIGNPNPLDPFAKSGKDPRTGLVWKPLELTDYRHEFGSLLDVLAEPDFLALNDKPGVQDLILHLIAAHHGYGRPYFPKAFDPERPDADAAKAAGEVPQRFGLLQRKYGRWGIAYLESLLRAADYAASAKPSREEPS